MYFYLFYDHGWIEDDQLMREHDTIPVVLGIFSTECSTFEITLVSGEEFRSGMRRVVQPKRGLPTRSLNERSLASYAR